MADGLENILTEKAAADSENLVSMFRVHTNTEVQNKLEVVC